MSDISRIHKSAGIITANRRLLVSRSKGKDYFVAPGGKLEAGETSQSALVRELQEEQDIVVAESNLEFFGTFNAIAKGHEANQLQITMDVYVIKQFTGSPAPSGEITENRWVTSSEAESIELGSIFAHDVIPALKRQDLID